MLGPGIKIKLEVVKREMARVNIDSLGISELKWTGMGECNSDDHYIYYCGQESLKRNGVAIMVNKKVQNAVVTGAWCLQPRNEKTLAPRKEGCDKPRKQVEKQSYHFVNKGAYSQRYGFSSSHVWM